MKLPFLLWGLVCAAVSTGTDTVVLGAQQMTIHCLGLTEEPCCYIAVSHLWGRASFFLFALPKSVTIALGFCHF